MASTSKRPAQSFFICILKRLGAAKVVKLPRPVRDGARLTCGYPSTTTSGASWARAAAPTEVDGFDFHELRHTAAAFHDLRRSERTPGPATDVTDVGICWV